MNKSTGHCAVRPEFLDCTFRDGGYYTNWDFDARTTAAYLESVARLPISIVEVGYVNSPKDGYYGQYYFLSVPILASIKSRLAPTQRLGVMLNAKDHQPDTVRIILDKMVGIVDVVRIAVSPSELAHALALGEELRRLGFEIGINLMYLSRFAEDLTLVPEFSTIAKVAHTLSLVDSYGSCEPNQVRAAVSQARELLPTTKIGFHGHDNLGLAFANSLAAVESGAVVIDGTMSGMGRGAGNTRTEMLLVRDAARTQTPLDFDALALVVDVFDELKEQYRWGTNLPYMISGSSDLPQKDVMHWVGKNRYSIVSILRALRGHRDDGLDTRSFRQLSPALDTTDFPSEVLIVGGGPSVREHIDGIGEYLRLLSTTVIHSNFRHLDILEQFGERQLVCLAGDGVTRLPHPHKLALLSALIVSEPPRLSGSAPEGEATAVVQVAPFAMDESRPHLGPVSDTGPFALGLGAALALGAKRISLVGFDGYQSATVAQQELAREIQTMLDQFRLRYPEVVIQSLTPTAYDLPKTSVYSRIVELSRRNG